MKEHPQINTASKKDVDILLRSIMKERRLDVRSMENLDNVFMRGRKVGKIPTGASDISASDRIGDFNFDAGFLYLCVDNSGTAEWRKAILSSW